MVGTLFLFKLLTLIIRLFIVRQMAQSSGVNLSSLENTLDLYLGQKAPSLPKGWREGIVRFLPWIVLILFIITLPVVLAAFGISAFFLPFSFVSGTTGGVVYLLGMIVLGLSLVFQAMAIPGLFKKTRQGWNLLFYSILLGAVQNLITFNLVGLIIGTLFSLYILFQIRSYYK